MPRSPEAVVLRYFDCRGRVQAIRNALVDANVAFEDVRLAIGPTWGTLKEQPAGGPFGSLPVLEWGSDCVAQTLPIAGYLARRFGEYDGLDSMGIARLEMLTSVAYLDIIAEIAFMLYVPTSAPDTEAAARFSNHEARILHKIDRLERMLAAGAAPFFGGKRPVVADFFVAEAVELAHAVLGERVEGQLRRNPKLAELREGLAQREAIARYMAAGKRPTRITGSPHEPDTLERIRRYVEGARTRA